MKKILNTDTKTNKDKTNIDTVAERKAVLIFTPHPDDHISCGGTVLKLAEKGYEVFEVLFTNGETGGQQGKVNVDKNELLEIRAKEFDAASKILGTKKVFKLNIPTNGVSYTTELFFELIKIIREVRPNIAIFPHPEDYHRDHREVSGLVKDAIIRSDSSFALHLGARFRVPVNLYCRGLHPLTEANLLVDISDQFEKLQQIVLVYASQISPRLKQYSESLPSAIGYYMRSKYAEEYEIPLNLPLFPDIVLLDLKS